MKRYISFIVILITLSACKPKPETINYGEDQCHFCKMSIVDEKFASEVITSKGKIYKYDDVHCMVKHVHALEHESTKLAFILVNNFENPSDFLNVNEAIFLTSDSFSSPMGGNTAAFVSEEKIVSYKTKSSTWSEIRELFKK